MAAGGRNAQAHSLFPSEYRRRLSCELFLAHDYVQMEKEQGSFVRGEAPPQPSRRADARLSYKKRLKGRLRAGGCKQRLVKLPRSAPSRLHQKKKNPEQLHSTSRTGLFPACLDPARCSSATWARTGRRGGTERTDVNSVATWRP